MIDDLDVEVEETVTVTLDAITTSDPSVVVGAASSATISIEDNEVANVVSVEATTLASEPTSNGAFTVSLDTVAATDTVIGYSVGGTATEGTDYTPLSGTVTIPGGSISALLDLAVLDDQIVEGAESVVITLDEVTQGDNNIILGATNTAIITITDDDVIGGAAVLEVTANSTNVQNSTFGSDSFQISNTGTKDITQVTIDVTDALYPDSVFDPFGVAGDSLAKFLTINSAGGTGVVAPSEASYIGAGGQAGYEGIQLSLDPSTSGGFNPGETVSFSADMDPNSIAGSSKATLESGSNPSWDVGGISGAELIGSNFTVTFSDGTTATGQLQGVGNQAGSQGIASQDALNIPVTLTVNGLGAGSVGTYNLDGPIMIVNGPIGATVRVVLTKGFIFPTANAFFNSPDPDEQAYAPILQAQLDALAGSDFPANNSVEFQTVDVVLTDSNQDISGAFDFSSVPIYDLPGEDQLPLGFVASVIDPDNDDLPLGPVTAPIYLEYAAGTVVSIAAGSNGNETGPVSGKFTVSLTTATTVDTVIAYSVAGTATAGADYTPLSGTVTILANETSATIDVAVLNDLIEEGTENVIVTLDTITSGDPSVVLSTATEATVTLADDAQSLRSAVQTGVDTDIKARMMHVSIGIANANNIERHR